MNQADRILEIGCGEGRDSRAVLNQGYDLLATDLSNEAIVYCKKIMPSYKDHFKVLDCISSYHKEKYDFIYSVAVIHMLVLNKDRNAFYKFIYEHLTDGGVALICSMGDGKEEMQSDINNAFKLQERPHKSGNMLVTGTSCRMVSFQTFERELNANGLGIIEKGITSALPDFNNLMFAVVQKLTM